MRSMAKFLLYSGLCAQLATSANIHDAPHHIATVIRRAESTGEPLLSAVVGASVKIAAVIPTEPGQIGINPPTPAPTPANIEKHTKYLTEDQGITKWIGVDTNYISVKVTTQTRKGGSTVVATITKGVEASKNTAGGLDIVISPAVRAQLEAIARQVTPCAARRRRYAPPKSRRAAVCGLADYVQRVGADQNLKNSFSRPLADQVWDAESNYGSDMGSEPGWEGDGVVHPEPESVDIADEGYFTDDAEGFYEGAAEPEGAADVVEAVVFSTPEEAAAIGASLAGSEAAANVALLGAATVTTGSFLARLWGYITEGKSIPLVETIPKDSIQRISKTRTKTQTATSTSTSSSTCPTYTGTPPTCGEGCKATSTKINRPQITHPDVVGWACSEGQTKDCPCSPGVTERITLFDVGAHQAVLDALNKIGSGSNKWEEVCPYSAFVPVTTTLFPDRPVGGLNTITACTCGCTADKDSAPGTPLYWGVDSNYKTMTSWCMSGTWAPTGYSKFTQGCSPVMPTPTSIPTPTQTSRPTERLPVECHPASKPLKEVQTGKQAEGAAHACDAFPTLSWVVGMQLKGKEPSELYKNVPWDSGSSSYTLWWDSNISPGCGFDPAAQPMVGKEECTNVLVDAYKQCQNNGMGGKIKIGCLSYEFNGLF